LEVHAGFLPMDVRAKSPPKQTGRIAQGGESIGIYSICTARHARWRQIRNVALA
jgi:hypothetical protein